MMKYFLVAFLFIFISCSSEDGIDGVNGVDGAQGSQGEQGLQGEIGPAGEDGNAILAGNGEPSIDIGVQGDFYLDKVSGELYGPKIDATTWGDPISLGVSGADGQDGNDGVDGQDGANGSQIFAGDVPPENTFGEDGDYYLDKITFDLYGPKTAGDWSTPINLKGTTDVRYTDWFNFEDDFAATRPDNDFFYLHRKAFGFMGNDFLDNGGSVLVYKGFVSTPALGNIPVRPSNIYSIPRFDSNGVHQWEETFRQETQANSGSVDLIIDVSNTQSTTRASFLTDIFLVNNKFFRIIFIPGGTLVNNRSEKTAIDFNNYEAVKKYYGIKD